MKVYLLWEAYGEYEDRVKNLKKCYLDKQKAIEEQNRLKAENEYKAEMCSRCHNCLAYHSNDFTEEDIDCEDLALRKDNINGCWCENEYTFYEESIFWVEDIEVTE